MRKIYFFMLCFVLASCGKVVSEESVKQVDLGVSVAKLKEVLGMPNEIKKLSSGDEEYIYLERISGNNEIIEVKRYIFLIRKGYVFDKQVRFEKAPVPYEILKRNAFDLQTSFK
ncbi:MAG: hypothetical protein WC371_00200 [Parachlamydiales bacterium]|jgi:hypothetical protein